MHRIIGVCFLMLTAGCTGQPDQAVQTKLDQVNQIFADWDGNIPGGAVAIISNDEVIYERYFGLANLEKEEPFTQHAVTDIGSVSKQFTALCIALLEEEGALRLDDDIRIYIPEIHEHAATITIKNLIFHTSGIKDHEELVRFRGEEPYGAHMNNQFAVQLIAKQETLNFEPGTAYEYSNANYVLLTEIIARVSEMPFDAYAQKHIFEPLGMKNTFFNLNQGEDFENRAWGYSLTPNGYERPVYKSQIIGDGGLNTTLRDFIKWDANFRQNTLGKGSTSLTERMKLREHLVTGQPNYMAFAQIETTHGFGKMSWSHGGSGGGYRSFYIRFEDPAFSVMVFANADEHNAFEKANAVVDLFLNNAPEAQEESQSPQPDTQIQTAEKLNTAETEQLAGYYLNKDNLQLVNITFNPAEEVFYLNWFDGNAPGYMAVARDAETLVESEDATQTYALDMEAKTLTHRIDGRTSMVFQKLAPFNKPMADYAGTYHSEALSYNFTLSTDGNTLTSNNIYFTSIMPISNNVFFDTQSKAMITFSGSSASNINAAELDIPLGDRSLRNMRFTKRERSTK